MGRYQADFVRTTSINRNSIIIIIVIITIFYPR